MIKLKTLLSAAALAALAAGPVVAQDDKTKDAKPDPAIGAEGPDCLDLHRIDRTEVVDDYTILFHMKGGKTYVSKLPYRCHGLGFEEGFAHSTSISRICGNVDTITVLRRGNSCALGPFHVYDKDKAKARDGDAEDGEGDNES